MSIENSFDRIATALEGISQRIDALGAAIAAMNGGTTTTPLHPVTPAQLEPLAEVVQAAAAAVDARTAEETPAPEPKKRGRPALKAVETPPAVEAAPVVEEAPAPLAPAEDAVKTAILAFAGKHGKQAAIDILSRHGAARVRDLNPTTYGAVLADIAKG